ncbi:WD40/YVTN/BNR-like repeat-containing protein [Costertonia aggregata]|uniref:Photosynthesis system II assembly factor Ycf48/Hcf136-like domain-containing protein n=1 Tax=Costertonia aggregata TaxID=343403 RepID=A0A7H9APM9_9FLAO|nr:hypothetical protein [Costertonia aggregata]QLG45343.1 hypothetical protein HYG79_08275 [Costertonia aggregata]
MLKKNLYVILVTVLFISCKDTKAQEEEKYIPVDEFSGFREITQEEHKFTPRKFINGIDSTEVSLVHSLTNTSFHVYNASAFESDEKGVLVGGTGLRIRSTVDGGKNWKQIQLSPFANSFHSVAFCNGEAFAVGEGSFIAKGDSTLNHWSVFNIKPLDGLVGDTHQLYKIKFRNKLGFAMGFDTGIGVSKPLILKTTDGGKNWSTHSHIGLENETGAIYDFDIVSESILYLVTQMGNAYKSHDGGTSWQILFSSERKNASLNSVDFKNENAGFIGGLSGTLLFTADGGENWRQSTSFNDSTQLNIADIKYISDETVAITTAQSFVDEERPTFAYLLDGNGKERTKPLLTKKDSTVFFEGDSYHIYPLNKSVVYLTDRNNLYKVNIDTTVK